MPILAASLRMLAHTHTQMICPLPYNAPINVLPLAILLVSMWIVGRILSWFDRLICPGGVAFDRQCNKCSIIAAGFQCSYTSHSSSISNPHPIIMLIDWSSNHYVDDCSRWEFTGSALAMGNLKNQSSQISTIPHTARRKGGGGYIDKCVM